MPIDWLYRTTLEVSLLIGLVLLIRAPVRQMLGAQTAYWLWFVPLLRVLMPERPSRPATILEAAGLPDGGLDVSIVPNAEVLVLPGSIPVAAIWVTGAFVWAGLRLVAWVRFRRLLNAGSTPSEMPPDATAQVPDRLRRLKVRYFSCSIPGAPFLTGLIRPAVYLPEDFLDRFNAFEQKCIVHHELMHLQRRDLWVQGAWELLRAVFWFNPAIHIAALALRDDQEFACDQSVLNDCNSNERFHYARALIVGAGPYLLPPTMAFFSRPKKRIFMIEKHRKSKVRTVAGLCLCALIGIATLTKAPLSMAQDQLDERLSLNFTSVPLEDVIGMFADIANVPIEGIDQVEGPTITIRLLEVPVRDALTQLLNCVGYTFESAGDTLEIVPLTPGLDDATFECIDIEIDEERTV